MKPVAVLGSGPAGLMAAWACMLAGVPVVVLSNGGKSRLGGAQFLHAPIPGMHQAKAPEAVVRFERRGDPEEYRRKAFGELVVPWRPWTDGGFPEERDAWSLVDAYDRMWDVFGESVESNAQPIDLQWIIEERDKFHMVISTIPLRALCRSDQHTFVSQRVMIHPEGFEELPENTVLFDGTKDKTWYRTCNIFGTQYTEWGAFGKVPKVQPIYADHKPISTTCNCLGLSRVLLVGRRGRWYVDDFTHDAFYDTMTAIGSRYAR